MSADMVKEMRNSSALYAETNMHQPLNWKTTWPYTGSTAALNANKASIARQKLPVMNARALRSVTRT